MTLCYRSGLSSKTLGWETLEPSASSAGFWLRSACVVFFLLSCLLLAISFVSEIRVLDKPVLYLVTQSYLSNSLRPYGL